MAQADTDNSIPAPGAEKPQDSLYLPTDISPEEVFQAIGRLRREARDEIDRLIGFLDKTDDYVSRELEVEDINEEGGDSEPSLGSFDRMADQSKAWRQQGEFSGTLDLEQDNADKEPDLSSTGDMHFNQERWAVGGRRDLEQDAAESGIGDQDGLDEQIPFRDWS